MNDRPRNDQRKSKNTREKHGINTEYMDRSADPGKNFFRFCNGKYLDTAKLPVGYSRWGAFEELRELSLNRMHDMMQEFAATDQPADSNAQKIGDFYAAGMNQAKIEVDGIKYLANEFAVLAKLRRRDLEKAVARLHELGIGAFFGFGSEQSLTDSSQMIASAVQAGLGLPDRDYYLNTDVASVQRREKYVAHIANMFRLLGEKERVAQRHAKAVMAIETKLAEASDGQ